MSRPIEIDKPNFDEAPMMEYITGQQALEKDALEKHDVYKSRVSEIEKHRKEFQARHRINTEAIDAARKLLNSKAPRARYAYLRTFDIARRLLNLDDQADMFPDHIDKGEAEAISETAA